MTQNLYVCALTLNLFQLFTVVGLQKKYFKTWQIGKDIKTSEPTDKDPIVDKEAENELEEVMTRNIPL